VNRKEGVIAELIAAIEPGHSVWIAGREIKRLELGTEMYEIDGERFTFMEVYDCITLEPPPPPAYQPMGDDPYAHLPMGDDGETCLACGGELRFDGYVENGDELWFCVECEREITQSADYSALDQNAHPSADARAQMVEYDAMIADETLQAELDAQTRYHLERPCDVWAMVGDTMLEQEAIDG